MIATLRSATSSAAASITSCSFWVWPVLSCLRRCRSTQISFALTSRWWPRSPSN